MENVTAGACLGSKAHGGLRKTGLIPGDRVEEMGEGVLYHCKKVTPKLCSIRWDWLSWVF